MLILSRRVGESVLIGKDVSVTILRVKGDHVRIGVQAPKEIAVQRDDLIEKIKPELIAASGESGDGIQGEKAPAG